MKKNIIIAGVARAGKTTLCSLIAKEFGYQHLAMDALIEGFEDLFPQMDIDTHQHDISHISKHIAPFINSIIKSGEYDKLDYGLVIDVAQLLPGDFLAHIDQDLCEIYYLVTDCETAAQRLELLDKHDTPKEYTFHYAPEKRLALCEDYMADCLLIKGECEKHGMVYYDARDRDGAFRSILGSIQPSKTEELDPQRLNLLRNQDRERITAKLKEALEPLDYIYAFWYEGADANGTNDSHSDIDYYIDFEDAYEEHVVAVVEQTLAAVAPLDYLHVMRHGHPKLRQRVYHLEGTSEYLMIDFCFQLHSRDRNEYAYIEGDTIETAKVIFDKDEIIRFKAYDASEYTEQHASLMADCDYRYTQHNRVLKYVARKQLPEALAYYQRYVVEPLVTLLRIQYTPAHPDYHLLHISSHLPKEEVAML